MNSFMIIILINCDYLSTRSRASQKQTTGMSYSSYFFLL